MNSLKGLGFVLALIILVSFFSCASAPRSVSQPEIHEDQEGGISGTGNAVLCKNKSGKMVPCSETVD